MRVMRDISFFAKGPTWMRSGNRGRVSSIIRATQISDYLGAKLNPTEDYENDVCIYVKPHIKPNEDYKFEGKPYLDIIDGFNLRHQLRKHTEVTAISCSEESTRILSHYFKNKIVTIPQHHCNFERKRRDRKGINVVGTIGTKGAFSHIPKEIDEGLKEMGIKFWKYSEFVTREDIVNFYLNIDVQLIWRPYRIPLPNPLKLINASSFGVPTIALDEMTFKEKGLVHCYVPVDDPKGFFFILKDLIGYPLYYKMMAADCKEQSEEYHIDHIAELYRKLCMT